MFGSGGGGGGGSPAPKSSSTAASVIGANASQQNLEKLVPWLVGGVAVIVLGLAAVAIALIRK